MTVFGTTYARQYDHVYADKEYARECDLVEEAFRRHASAPVRSLLDLGCGTGGHAILFADRGYEVTAVDRSADMLSVAREKEARRQRPAGAGVAFHESDIQSLDLGRQFDACVMMFAVLSYQTTDPALTAGLAAVRRSLRSGGLFLCDFWYAPAVLAIGPSEQRREFALGDGITLRRVASGQLLPEEHAIEVSVKTWELAAGTVVRSAEESHRMRYFFEDEFRLHLSKAGLELVSLSAMPTLDAPLSTETWNVFAVARAQ